MAINTSRRLRELGCLERKREKHSWMKMQTLTLRFRLRWMLLLRHTIPRHTFLFRPTLFFHHPFFFRHTFFLRQTFLFWQSFLCRFLVVAPTPAEAELSTSMPAQVPCQYRVCFSYIFNFQLLDLGFIFSTFRSRFYDRVNECSPKNSNLPEKWYTLICKKTKKVYIFT